MRTLPEFDGEERFQYELAEKLGRTVEELLHGSGAFRPMSAVEMLKWRALWRARNQEHEKARQIAASKRK